MEDVTDDQPDDQRPEADEDARAQLVQMLDQRRLFAVTESPRQPLHSPELDGVAFALARGNRGVGRLHRQLGRLVVAILAADRVLELPHTASHGATDLGKTLRAEEQKNNEKNKKQIAPRKQVRQAGEGAHGRGNIQTRWSNLQGILGIRL